MKFLTLVLLGLDLYLVSPGSTDTATDMRNVMLQLTKECQHQFSSCGEKLNILDQSKGNYCEATKAAKDCSLTSTPYYDDDGKLYITGICTEEEFNKILAAACGTTDTKPDSNTPETPSSGESTDPPSTEEKVKRRINTRQEWDKLDDACRNHSLLCFNLDPDNTTTVLVDQALVCENLNAKKDCITGNMTGDSNATSPCTMETFNNVRGVACGAPQLIASVLLTLVVLCASSSKALVGVF